jgi:hypothetical protein
MAGGFRYWIEMRAARPMLISESWSRMADGAGQRHEVTADGATLVEEGFA